MSVKLRWRKLKNGIKSAQLDIFHDGKRIRETLDIKIGKGISDSKEKKRLAEAIRSQRELDLITSKHNLTPLFRDSIDFISYFENYVITYPKKDYYKARGAFFKFKGFIKKESINFEQITDSLCERYMEFLRDPEQSNLTARSTQRDYWAMFKAVLKTAKKQKIISSNPASDISFRGLSRTITQVRKNILSTEELKKLGKTECDKKEVKRAFLFACFTGLGLAEIKTLTFDRIKNNKLIIYRAKTEEQILNELPEVALKAIGEFREDKDLIFPELESFNTINRCLTRWAKSAGIDKNITFYCGRHTFATQLLLNGADLKTVMDCLGQTSTKSVIKYVNYIGKLKTEAISKLPTFDVDL